jgi:hypothetical protein
MAAIEQDIFKGRNISDNVPPAAATFTTHEEPYEARVNHTTVTEGTNGGEGSLKGSPPSIFDGSRKSSQMFFDDFEVLWGLNEEVKTMKQPYSCILTATTYMKGPGVDNWKHAQIKLLKYRVKHDGIDKMNEALWMEFEDNFKKMYTETTSKQDTRINLKTLTMTNNDLDGYITDYDNLIEWVEVNMYGEWALKIFERGLKKQLRPS